MDTKEREIEVKVVMGKALVMTEPNHKSLYEDEAKVGMLLWVGPIENGFFSIVEPVEWVGKWIYIGLLAPTGRSRDGKSA